MLQQSVPVTRLAPLKTLVGTMMAHVCTPEHGCVLSQVMVNLRIDYDGSWFCAFWDPDNPLRRAEATGTHPCEVDAVANVLEAISLLPLELSPDLN